MIRYSLNVFGMIAFVLYGYIFYDILFKRAAVYVMIVSIFSVLMEYILTIACVNCLDVKEEKISYATIVLLFCLLTLRLLNFLFQYFLVRLMQCHGVTMEEKRVQLLVLIVYSMYFAVFGYTYCFYDINYFKRVENIILFGSSLVFEILIFVLSVFFIIDYHKRENEYEENLNFVQNQLIMFDGIQRKLDANQNLMHDMKNHLYTIDLLIEAGKIEEAKDYTLKLMPDFNHAMEAGFDSSVISVILYGKRVIAKEKHISLTCGIQVTDIHIPLPDLNYIITNLLDNAIEATEKLVNWKKRQITFKVYIVREYVVIECENTYQGNIQLREDGTIETTKKEKANHGMGLRRIEQCARKNRGEFSFEYTDSLFLARVMFNKTIATIEEDEEECI